MNPFNQDLYGNYRNRKFTDIWGDYESFAEDYTSSKLDNMSSEFPDSITTLYYLLYARYGNSTIASSDENQFKYKVFTLIFMYGPTWAKRLELQKQIRGLSIEELRLGATAIHNHAYNPSTAPSTQSLDELTYINDQNVQKYKKSLGEAYGVLIQLLETDVTAYFLDRFRSLFLTIVEPELPLWYETELEPAEEPSEIITGNTNATVKLTGGITDTTSLVSGTTGYYVNARVTPGELRSVIINVIPSDTTASVAISKSVSPVANGSTLKLNEGENLFTIVINSKGKSETYYLIITVAVFVTDGTLRLTGGKSAGVGLKSGIKSYIVEGDVLYVDRNAVIAEVVPASPDATSKMTMGGVIIANNTNLSLKQGSNTLIVTITNGSKSESYSIVISVSAPAIGPVPYKWTYIGSDSFENPTTGDKLYDLTRQDFSPATGTLQADDSVYLPINKWLGKIGLQYDSEEFVGYFIEYVEAYNQ